MQIRCKICDEIVVDTDSIMREIKRCEYYLNLSNEKWKEEHENIIYNYRQNNYKKNEIITNSYFYKAYNDTYKGLFFWIKEYDKYISQKDRLGFCSSCAHKERKKRKKLRKIKKLMNKDKKETDKLVVNQNVLNEKRDIYSCKKCNKNFKDFHSLDQHMASKKHKDEWEEYFNQDEVKKRLLEKNLIHDNGKGQLVKENRNKLLKEKSKKDNKRIRDLISNSLFTRNRLLIKCEYCNEIGFKDFYHLDKHIHSKHIEKWNDYKKKNKWGVYSKNTILKRCQYCGIYTDKIEFHLKEECPHYKVECFTTEIPKKIINNGINLSGIISNKEVEKIHYDNREKEIVEDTLIEDDIKLLNLENEKDEAQKENIPKLKEQILKHKSEIEQYDEDINDELLTNEEEYYENIRKKLEYNLRNYSEADKQKILKQYVYTTRKSAIDLTLRNEIRSYLYKIYRGYCQICGFTFRKFRDRENSFEMHNWDNKLVVKTKSYLVSSADSLCLCRNCSANIKWGAFEPIFMDKINNIEDFANKSLDEVKEAICVELEDNVVKKFKDNYEWEDIYALEITVNDEPKNIYMTNGHLIQFIAYLQLEER